jgi:pimeloyl-ACP methyl ester carboxylesterase
MLGGLVEGPDSAVLTGEFADAVAAGFRESTRVGPDGWIDDFLAFVRPWGFDLREIKRPVGVWQGGADRMVAAAHGSFLAERLPNVHAHLLPEEGHLSIALGRFDEIVSEAASFLRA